MLAFSHLVVEVERARHELREAPDSNGRHGLRRRALWKLRTLAFSASIVRGHAHRISFDREPCHFHPVIFMLSTGVITLELKHLRSGSVALIFSALIFITLLIIAPRLVVIPRLML